MKTLWIEVTIASLLVGLSAWSESRASSGAGQVPVGIDRIDQRSSTLNGRYSAVRSGARVTIWVLDDRCDNTHPEFAGRLTNVFDTTGGSGFFGNHGTQMASIAAGSTVGVAKGAQINCIDIIDSSGLFTVPHVTSAVNYILAQPRTGREVANLSFEKPADAALDAEVQRLLDANITVVVAAGNGAQGAGGTSPARVVGAITVGNVRVGSSGDEYFFTSNVGPLIDLQAPGVSIQAAVNGGGYSSAGDGTSPAAAHVTGVAALFLEGDPQRNSSPAQVEAALKSAATVATIANLPIGTTNKVVFSDFLQPTDLEFAPAPGSSELSQRIGSYSGYAGNNGDKIHAVARRKISGDAEVSFYVGGYANSTSEKVSCGFFTETIWSYRGFLNRVRADGTSLWASPVTFAPPDTVCGYPAGGAEVVSIATDPATGDAWVLLREVGRLQNAPEAAKLARIRGSDGFLLQTIQIGSSGYPSKLPKAITEPFIDGSFWVVGTVNGSDTFFTAHPPTGGSDVFAVRFDSSGNTLCKVQLGTAAGDVASAAVASGANVAVGGSTTGAFPGFTSAGAQDGFVIKISQPNCNLAQSFQRGTSSDDIVRAITAVGPDIFAAGITNGALETLLTAGTGQTDAFVWRINGTSWTRTYGGQIGSPGWDQFSSVTGYELRDDQFVLLAGHTYGSIASINPDGARDALIARIAFEKNGGANELRWMWQSSTSGDDEVLGCTANSFDTFATNGGRMQFVGTTSGSFPPYATPAGASDGFRIRFTGF